MEDLKPVDVQKVNKDLKNLITKKRFSSFSRLSGFQRQES